MNRHKLASYTGTKIIDTPVNFIFIFEQIIQSSLYVSRMKAQDAPGFKLVKSTHAEEQDSNGCDQFIVKKAEHHQQSYIRSVKLYT